MFFPLLIVPFFKINIVAAINKRGVPSQMEALFLIIQMIMVYISGAKAAWHHP
jgi:hypothetical protein